MNKTELKGLLQERVQGVVVFSENQTSEVFYAKPAADVWSVAENVQHLILSVQPLARIFGAPKSYFIEKWGKAPHSSRAYEQMVEIYDAALGGGGVATGAFVPLATTPSKEQLLTDFVQIHQTLLQLVEANWSEEELDEYPIPHPLLGLITAREMLYFTAYHLLHHHQIMKKRVEQVA